jgi:hypothetical protein
LKGRNGDDTEAGQEMWTKQNHYMKKNLTGENKAGKEKTFKQRFRQKE